MCFFTFFWFLIFRKLLRLLKVICVFIWWQWKLINVSRINKSPIGLTSAGLNLAHSDGGVGERTGSGLVVTEFGGGT